MRSLTALVALAAFATTAAAQGGMGGMNHDPDKNAGGTGVPKGYVGLVDRPNAKIGDAKYVTTGGTWEITTGPAHIVYSPSNTASGVYGVSSTFEQLQAPAHPEAYGIFIGGSHLDDPAQQKYTYFIVRGTGEYMVKVRDGAQTKTIVPWTASPNLPKQDASGKATYAMTVHVAPDTVHFQVNGKLVAAVPKSEVPTDGIYGLRVNHNLHISATPIKKQ